MKTQYFVTLTALVLALGWSQAITNIQAPKIPLNSMFTDFFVQGSPFSISLQPNQASTSPPVDDRPDDRTPAGTRLT